MRHLPNLICLIRLALIWPILMALHAGESRLALALFIIAAASDGVDGYLAKRFDWTSELGKFLDPLADKLIVAATLVWMVPMGRIPAWAVVLLISREITITALRSIARAPAALARTYTMRGALPNASTSRTTCSTTKADFAPR